MNYIEHLERSNEYCKKYMQDSIDSMIKDLQIAIVTLESCKGKDPAYTRLKIYDIIGNFENVSGEFIECYNNYTETCVRLDAIKEYQGGNE